MAKVWTLDEVSKNDYDANGNLVALTEDESLLKSKARQYSRAGAELLSGISPVPLDLSILNLTNPLIPGEKYDVEFKTFGEKIAPTVQERAKDENLSKQMDELNFK